MAEPIKNPIPDLLAAEFPTLIVLVFMCAQQMVSSIQKESQEARESIRMSRLARRLSYSGSLGKRTTTRRSARVAGMQPVSYKPQLMELTIEVSSRPKRRKTEFVASMATENYAAGKISKAFLL